MFRYIGLSELGFGWLSIIICCAILFQSSCSSTDHTLETENNTDQSQNQVPSSGELDIPNEILKSYSVDEGEIRFSFSYPSNYSLINDDITKWGIMVSLSDNLANDDIGGSHVIINSYRYGTLDYNGIDEYYDNALAVIRELPEITNIYNGSYNNNAMIGYQIEYSFMYGPPLEPIPDDVELESIGFTRVVTKRILFIDNDDNIWDILIRIPFDNYEEQKNVLDVILDSMTIYE